MHEHLRSRLLTLRNTLMLAISHCCKCSTVLECTSAWQTCWQYCSQIIQVLCGYMCASGHKRSVAWMHVRGFSGPLQCCGSLQSAHRNEQTASRMWRQGVIKAGHQLWPGRHTCSKCVYTDGLFPPDAVASGSSLLQLRHGGQRHRRQLLRRRDTFQ
jgi:hypothetical protein